MPAEILSPTQRTVLRALSQESSIASQFYLTGGTALSAYYLQHRYSEDLDFFSEQEVDPLTINMFLKSKQKDLMFDSFEYQQSFNRNLYFLQYGTEELKMEFTYYPFPQVDKPERRDGLLIDSVVDIATNKLFTIYQRTTARDYIDLYLLCRTKDLSIDSLMKKARVKFDWHIDPLLLGSQFFKANDVADLPRMIIQLPDEEWRNFFLNESKKLKDDVME